MNPNLWNVKEMFSTPIKMGPNKPLNWTSDYSSMSDSQFLFGSQFCPENSQSALTPLELKQDKSSQQNSQDNEPSIFAKYQSKPQLFAGDGKEKGPFSFPAGRFKGVLEQFEENKKKIKEKHDNELLNTFILNTKESLQRLHFSLDKFEETLKSILDGFGSFSKSMQETSQSYYELVLNALRDKNEMEQALLGVEKKRLENKDTEISDLKSSLQSLTESLEQLTAQQKEQHLKLCERLEHLQLPSLLADLQTFISAPRVPIHIKDSVSQTSPDMMSRQVPNNSHSSDAPPGSLVISTAAASQGKENADIQQSSRSGAGSRDADRLHCTCRSSADTTAGSHEECLLYTQGPSLSTPLRKVIKKGSRAKGLNTPKQPQLNWTHIDSADSHKNMKLARESMMQIKGGGSRIKREPQKYSEKKILYSSRKGGNHSKVTTNARQGFSKSIKSPQLLLQFHENSQNIPNMPVTSGVKKKVDLSCSKNNSFWAGSSPESSFSENQVRWLNLSDDYSSACGKPAQQKTRTYCPLFFDSDFSD
ncbi:interactor of HORMAD1 protein 1 [Podarcis raffonei]|uniref:interactor of HORMAD1 protein 1 n=1 Tax=Podarcis raffonei TaxID=65483 RepID=UPI002329478D|nr:interactor of HORMAD1 protein 1 [Podarcis raffonei]XP_053234453.1 interactor of HORMAD1 protein 1 [Podarcis raffonei]XP_053234455.1 interactor of HORMAD1 protein 1 [Podarcis raffonei]XP_053234456.1 interactor of HORMAD1 protein 1 [Podarcis raffonei]XP_053234457.1 interactor of HORMAD1 protein 1 [Podarcis raffonei]XP_053234458.1 interactor of HORMAD1 protein 1 [Podarcis raffonei]XP_053234459.1 interactor of HORMAD1 protein 1 [Podarcis raffonei]